MREHTLLQEDEMVRRAIDALMNNLGPVETARFLNLPRARRLNSVLRHRKWQAGLDKNRFFDQVFGKETRA
jgi:transposase-like protein